MRSMRMPTINEQALGVMLVLFFLLGGFVVEFQPQLILEENGGFSQVAQMNNQGIDQFKENNFPKALGSFVFAAQLNQEVWQPHFNCAVTLVAMGRSDEAIDHLELSLDIDPFNALAWEFYRDLIEKVNRFT